MSCSLLSFLSQPARTDYLFSSSFQQSCTYMKTVIPSLIYCFKIKQPQSILLNKPCFPNSRSLEEKLWGFSASSVFFLVCNNQKGHKNALRSAFLSFKYNKKTTLCTSQALYIPSQHFPCYRNVTLLTYTQLAECDNCCWVFFQWTAPKQFDSPQLLTCKCITSTLSLLSSFIVFQIVSPVCTYLNSKSVLQSNCSSQPAILPTHVITISTFTFVII